MPSYSYPSNSVLSRIAQDKLPVLTMDNPIFKLFPIKTVKADTIFWEQKDNYKGLQAVRGLGGQPRRVNPVGAKRYEMKPGYYGEFYVIDEELMTRARQLGSYADVVDLATHIAEGQDILLGREITRIAFTLWTLIVTGTFSVLDQRGQVSHSDTFSIQTLTAATPWATVATATPLQNFRDVKLKARGHSVRFDSTSTAYMSQQTFNYMTANTNSADLGGKRTDGLGTVIGLADSNKVLMKEDLPQIQIMDEGYFDESGTFQLFIPDNKVVVVGARTDGSPIGNYYMTLNANNPGYAPGMYTKTIDKTQIQTPPEVELQAGHNGGPALEFPSAIVALSV